MGGCSGAASREKCGLQSGLHSVFGEVTGGDFVLLLLPDPHTFTFKPFFPGEKDPLQLLPQEHMEGLCSGSPVTSSSQCFGGRQQHFG